jgi:hypothetical protein
MSLLRNVLAGIGSYLVKEGELNEQAARDDLLFRRQVALEQVKEQYLERASARDHTERLDEISATAAENRRTALYEGVVADRRDSSKAARDLQHDITLKKIDFSNSTSLEKLKSKLNMNEAQFTDFLKQKSDAEAAGQKVNRVVFSKNGQLQLVMDNGDIHSKGPSGAYNPSGADTTGADLGDYLNSGGAVSGSSISRTEAQPTPSAGIAPVAPAQPPGSVMSQLSRLPPPPDGKVGRTMTGPNGMKASWNGKVWVLADVNGGQ